MTRDESQTDGGAGGDAGPGVAVMEKARALPAGPGVYLFKDDAGQVLYVGKAASLRSRVGSSVL